MRRAKLIAKTARANIRERALHWPSGVPKKYTLLNGMDEFMVDIANPKYKEKALYLEDESVQPFVETPYQNIKWLYDFVTEILERKESETIPFLNSKLDYQNPGMSAYRIYANDGTFIQVQVRRLPESQKMFQLDYFEPTISGNMLLKMVLICDISEAAACIVYSRAGNKSDFYAARITSSFRDLMIFLRTWDYSINSKLYTITPFPEKFFC